MRRNIKQNLNKSLGGQYQIPDDWFYGRVPPNVKIDKDTFIDSAYCFEMFHSTEPEALIMGKGSGLYDNAQIVISKSGKISVGEFCVLNGTTLICSENISIGNYVMASWGSVITDNFMGQNLTTEQRALILKNTAKSSLREFPLSESLPVTIEDNVWIGFDAIILPGTHIGRGSIIGSKTIVSGKIPEYSVMAGNPAKHVRTLSPTDKNRPSPLK